MVYKKFIVKNGRVYGPYIYHSKRVDGKVVSEYHGSGSSFNFKPYLTILGILFGLLLVGYGIYSFGPSLKEGFSSAMTGNVILGVDANYNEVSGLNGLVKISLKKGELLPASSELIIENNDLSSGFLLSDVLENNVTEGDFYIEGKSISGKGYGYGIQGVKKDYPSLSFKINIYTSGESSVGSDSGEGNSGGSSEETPVEETPVEVPVEEIPETPIESAPVENPIQETPAENPIEEIPAEIPSDNSNAGGNSENNANENSNAGGNSESNENANSNEASDVSSNPAGDSVSSEGSGGNTGSSESSSSDGSESSGSGSLELVGNFVLGLLKSTSNFFLSFFDRASITGNVVSSDALLLETIDGSVSYDSPFNYNLNKGQTAEIVSGSVLFNEEVLSDESISLSISNGKIEVTTDYSIDKEGFGGDYAGDKGEEFTIDVSKLGFSAVSGPLNLKIVYDDEELISVSTTLSNDGVIVENETEEIEIPLNETDELNATLNESKVVISTNLSLSDSEKEILASEFGNSSVEIVKAESFNGRVIIRYQLQDYWVEHSYDSDSFSLNSLMERDRIKWLKSLAEMLSQNSEEPEELGDLKATFSIQ